MDCLKINLCRSVFSIIAGSVNKIHTHNTISRIPHALVKESFTSVKHNPPPTMTMVAKATKTTNKIFMTLIVLINFSLVNV